jgi:uncharacterized YigZ family protein
MKDAFSYNTIDQVAVAEFTDRGSKFIAYANPIHSVDAFKVILQKLKKEHPKAVHHCFAYRLGLDGNLFRVSDDGEPSGSAGRPILGQIDSSELTDIAIIVVRYFGGTLLGVPGLINAYKTAAALALQVVPTIQKPIEDIYELEFDYTLINEVMTIVKRYPCTIYKQDMQLFCHFKIGIPRQHLETCLQQLKHVHGVDLKPSAK